MKRFLAVLVAFAVAALPVAASALVPDPQELSHDDGVFDSSAQLDVLASIAVPPLLPPAVQFDAPTADVYALDAVSFYLLPVPPTVAPGEPTLLPTATTDSTYPVTVQIWNQTPPGTDWVPGEAIDANLDVIAAGWYALDLLSEKLTFTGSIRVAIYLRDDSAVPVDPVPIPVVPVHIGLDTTGPFGLSYAFDPAAPTPAAAWVQDLTANYGIRATVHLVPALTCQGFLPPFNKTITMKKGGRTIPLKAFLFDADGFPVTRKLLTAAPLVELLYDNPDDAMETADVTDMVAPAGRSNKGQAFRNAGRGKWIYNLKTKKSLQPGIYTVQIGSGDVTEYAIDPTCTGTFVIEAPKPKKGKK